MASRLERAQRKRRVGGGTVYSAHNVGHRHPVRGGVQSRSVAELADAHKALAAHPAGKIIITH